MHPDVSFSLYTTLIRGDSMGLPEDELQSLTAQPWDDRVCRIESSRDEQGVMSTLLIASSFHEKMHNRGAAHTTPVAPAAQPRHRASLAAVPAAGASPDAR